MEMTLVFLKMIKMVKVNSKYFESRIVTVVKSNKEYKGEYGIVATKDIPSGTNLFKIDGVLTKVPSRYSVQVGHNLHIDIPESYDLEMIITRFYWRFMNHNCEPNARIQGTECFALKPIKAGQEVTFNYNTTEYEMAEPFECCCGSDHCVGRIRGFSFLSRSEKEQISPWIANHLLSFMKDDLEHSHIVDNR